MRYDEFRDRLLDALRDVGLLLQNGDRPIETIDLANTERRWQVHIWRPEPQGAEPFHVSARICLRLESRQRGARVHVRGRPACRPSREKATLDEN